VVREDPREVRDDAGAVADDEPQIEGRHELLGRRRYARLEQGEAERRRGRGASTRDLHDVRENGRGRRPASGAAPGEDERAAAFTAHLDRVERARHLRE